MKGHIEKAQNNEKFINFLEQSVPTDFYDWKTTIIFYAGYHYLIAFIKFNKVASAFSHKQTDAIINPANPQAKLPLPEDIYTHYQTLYLNSRLTRYYPHEGGDFQLLLLQVKTAESKKSLLALKAYFKKEGLKF